MPFHETKAPELQGDWAKVKSVLEKFGLSCTLNLVEGLITVSTTSKTRIPYMILKARRCYFCREALTTLKGRHQLLRIGHGPIGLCTKFGINKEQYEKRRKLLIGSPLEELSQLTGCDLYLHEDLSIAATGPTEGMRLARKIVTDCIVHRVHPAFQFKKFKMNPVNQGD
ncbi:KRR1 small subunit processome component-like isoform X2 [Prunus avium]|uniref:KRR-R motif-containing protein 1 n=1 Tax=Prunus avium TaxID=42229 RepID=A0A6P5RGQ9_PRUAV|nr:KRR1 small subunit processome component-like isoform X2 [Prunus avium]